MNLSHKLTFSIFSILLVAALVCAPAVMAQTTITARQSGTAATATAGETIVITLTYSDNPDPKPTLSDFTAEDGAISQPTDGDRDVLTASYNDGSYDITVDLDTSAGKTVTLTFTGPAGAGNDIGLPAVLKLAGYDTNLNTAQSNATQAATTIAVAAGHVSGKGYLIIASNESPIGQNVYPTFPTSASPNAIVKRAWANHSDDTTTTMPDLYSLFRINGGGTLHLTLIKGDLNNDNDIDDANERDMAGTANDRTIVINEVMWAYDNSQVGNQVNRVREQWIEVHNRTTTPIAFNRIRITTEKNPNGSPAGLNNTANQETDSLSTYASYTSAWSAADFDNRGQHGNAGSGTPPTGQVTFVSMHRTGYGVGWDTAQWELKTKADDYFLPNFKGTPGNPNSFSGIPGVRPTPSTDTPAKGTFVINEIGNMNDNTLDWIEIKNINASAQSLKNWALSKVTAYNNEAEIYRFPDKSIPAGGILLLVNEHPDKTPLARGYDLSVTSKDDQDFGADSNISYLIIPDNKLVIPNNNNWLLILRSGNPWNVKDGRSVWNSGHRLQDVAGALKAVVEDLDVANPRKEKKADGAAGGDIWQTTLFPMNGRSEGGDKVLAHDRNLSNKVWTRNTGLHGWQRKAFDEAPFTGIGYDRNVTADKVKHGGTPGYDNGVAKGKAADVSDGTLVISELMLTTNNGRYPQWIELRNTSKTQGINLAAEGEHTHADGTKHKHRWQVHIENHHSGTWKSKNRPLNITINLQDWFKYIPPNQTVLIAAFKSSTSANLPDNRYVIVTDTKRSTFKMEGRRDAFLNAEGGFLIQIEDSSGAIVDEVGNLDGKKPVIGGLGYDDPVGFTWPTDLTEGEERSSLIRLKDAKGKPFVGVPTRDDTGAATDTQGSVLPIGIDKIWLGKGKTGTGEEMKTWAKYADHKYAAWIHASDTDMLEVPRAQKTYFGNVSDIGTPLHVAGAPLPVELSFFRPTLENGKVTIQWTTESELDNAGFNILRSDTRNGEFTQVNEQMIQGNGTTAERTTYKWVDTTAKPGAVYYYQIEDVSFAGEHNTLATTKLKGLISAKGKLTTQWGDLKNLR